MKIRRMPDGKEKYTMTIEQCYSAIESNYEEVLGRFAGNKMLVEKFARKFLDDQVIRHLSIPWIKRIMRKLSVLPIH